MKHTNKKRKNLKKYFNDKIVYMKKYKVNCRYTFTSTPYGNTVYVVKQMVSFLSITYWKSLRVFWQRKEADEFLKTLI